MSDLVYEETAQIAERINKALEIISPQCCLSFIGLSADDRQKLFDAITALQRTAQTPPEKGLADLAGLGLLIALRAMYAAILSHLQEDADNEANTTDDSN